MTFSVVLGNLNLHDINNYFIPQPNNPGEWLGEDGTVRFPVLVRGSSASNVAAKRRAIIAEINRAETAWRFGRESERVALAVALQTIDTVYFDVQGGPNVGPAVRVRERHHGGTSEIVDVTLACESENGVAITRLAADVRATSGTLTNGSAKILIDGIQGDRPARTRIELQDVSTSGAINRMRLSIVSAESLVLSDWEPWVDIAHAGSSNQSDGSAFGDSYERVNLSSASSWSFLGRAVMPAGAMQRGWRHLYLRLRDHASTTPAPSGLGSSIDAPAQPGAITQRQTAVGSGTGTQVSASWGSLTQNGNTLMLAVKAQNPQGDAPETISRRQGGGTSGTSDAPARSWGTSTQNGSLLVMTLRFEGNYEDWTPPNGWSLVPGASNPGSPNVHTVMLYDEGASVHSGSESGGSFASPVDWSMYTTEYTDVATSGALIAVGTNTGDGTSSLSLSVSTPTSLPRAVIVAADGVIGSIDNRFSWSNNFIERFDDNGFGVADRIVSSAGSQGTSASYFPSDDHAGVIAAFAAAEQSGDPPSEIAMTPPAGYALAGLVPNLNDEDAPLTTALFYRQDAPATSGSQTVTFSESVTATIRLIEIVGLATTSVLADVVTATSSGAVGNLGPSALVDQEGTLALAVFGAYSTSTTWSGHSGDFTHIGTFNGLSVARATSGALQAWSATAVASATDAGAHILAIFRQRSLDDDPPGQLEPGTIAARVRCVNRGGGVGSASGTHNAVVSLRNSAALFTWSAPATTAVSHYELELTFEGVTYQIITEDATTSYRLESLAGLARGSFGVASVAPNQIQVQVGTDDMTASTSGSRNENFRVIHTARTDRDLLGVWHFHDAALEHLPIQQQIADGSQPGWAVEAFGRNSGGPAANMDIDALVALSDESGMTLEYPGFNLATPRLWVAEIRRDGSVVAWLEDGSGNFVGQVRSIGRLKIPPGKAILTIVMEQAGRVAAVDAARATLQLTMYPAADWLV